MTTQIFVYGVGEDRKIFDVSSHELLVDALTYVFARNLAHGVYDQIMRNPNHVDQISRSLIPQAMAGNEQSIEALVNWRKSRVLLENETKIEGDPEYFDVIRIHPPSKLGSIPKRTF